MRSVRAVSTGHCDDDDDNDDGEIEYRFSRMSGTRLDLNNEWNVLSKSAERVGERLCCCITRFLRGVVYGWENAEFRRRNLAEHFRA